MKKPRGFTLIELLVVISIISLLSSIILASLQEARALSRDSRRIQDLLQLQNALALYQLDNNGDFPVPFNFSCINSTGLKWNTSGLLKDLLVSRGYISSLPVDPKDSQCSFVTPAQQNYNVYAYFNNGVNYSSGYNWGGPGTCDGKPILIAWTAEKRSYRNDCGFNRTWGPQTSILLSK